jgi:hypothetical protein
MSTLQVLITDDRCSVPTLRIAEGDPREAATLAKAVLAESPHYLAVEVLSWRDEIIARASKSAAQRTFDR